MRTVVRPLSFALTALAPRGSVAAPLALALALAACAEPTLFERHDYGVDPPDGAAASGDVALGERSARARGCTSCHDPGDGSMAGRLTPLPGTAAYPSNLTPDPDTGLGTWGDEQLGRAIREGIDDQGLPMCGAMPRFGDLDDAELGALVAWLRSLPPVHRLVPDTACSDGADGDAAAGGGAPLAGAADAAVPNGTPPDAAAPPDLAAPLAGPCAPVINEVATAGANGAADEYVELFNPCAAAAPLDGLRLVYRSSAGANDVNLARLPSKRLAAGAFFVIAGPGFLGAADLQYNVGGLAARGGGVGLRDGSGALLGSVGWGDATNAFVRAQAADAPSDRQSIGRVPDGADSGNDHRDLPITAPTPGAPNR